MIVNNVMSNSKPEELTTKNITPTRIFLLILNNFVKSYSSRIIALKYYYTKNISMEHYTVSV